MSPTLGWMPAAASAENGHDQNHHVSAAKVLAHACRNHFHIWRSVNSLRISQSSGQKVRGTAWPRCRNRSSSCMFIRHCGMNQPKQSEVGPVARRCFAGLSPAGRLSKQSFHLHSNDNITAKHLAGAEWVCFASLVVLARVTLPAPITTFFCGEIATPRP